MKEDLYAPRDHAVGYVKDDVTYIPHYTKFGVYVGPGYLGGYTQRTYTESELESHGAKKQSLLLWNRPKAPKAH